MERMAFQLRLAIAFRRFTNQMPYRFIFLPYCFSSLCPVLRWDNQMVDGMMRLPQKC